MRYLVKSIDDLIQFSKISAQHKEAIDNYIDDVWCRCFTVEDIDKAVEEGDEYIIGKAIDAHRWYNDTSIDNVTGKKNAEKINKLPVFALSDFTMQYANSRFYEIDEMLLASGLVNMPSDYALVKACEHPNYDKVRFLLSKGANPDAMAYKSFFELIKHCLLNKGKHVTRTLLLLLGKMDDIGYGEETLKLVCKYHCPIEVIREIIRRAGRVNDTNGNCGALFTSLEKGYNPNIVKCLLLAGANPNSTRQRQVGPGQDVAFVHIIGRMSGNTSREDEEIIRLLIRFGAKIRDLCIRYKTDTINILMFVQSTVTVQYLLDAMVDNNIDMINDKTAEGLTPVQCVTMMGRGDVAQCLVDNGAMPNVGCVNCIATPHSISRFIADWCDTTITNDMILNEKGYNRYLQGNGDSRSLSVYDLVHIAEALKIPIRKPYSITSLLKLIVSKRDFTHA